MGGGGLFCTPSSFACHGSSEERVGSDPGMFLLQVVEMMGEVDGDVAIESVGTDDEVT